MDKEVEVESSDDNFDRLMGRWCIPRLAGSKGSYDIINLLKEDFKPFGFDFTEKEFPVFKSDTSFRIHIHFVILTILFIAFLLLFWLFFWWSALAVIAIFVYSTRLKKPRVCTARIEKRLKAGEKYEFTQSNLVYRLKPKKERKCSILLMAHHDSKSQTFPTVFRVYFAFLLVFIFLLLATMYLLCIALEFLGITQHLWLRPFTFGLGWINVVIFLLLSFNRISNKSPGALDNASGLYTIWRIANDCTDLALQNSEIWLILTGAEEIGQIGAAEFINEFREELDPESTYLINYEMMGLKNVPLKVLESFSFPRKRSVSPFLLPIIFESATELKIALKGWYLPIGAHTDGLLFRKEGFKGIDFVTKEAGRYTHLSRDVANLIDPMIIDDLVRLSIGIIKKLDEMF